MAAGAEGETGIQPHADGVAGGRLGEGRQHPEAVAVALRANVLLPGAGPFLVFDASHFRLTEAGCLKR